MNKEDIKTFVVKHIEMKGKLPDGIDLDSFDFVLSGYVDSLAIIQFVVTLEDRYDIEISDEEVLQPEFRTIGGLVATIFTKINEKGSDQCDRS